MKSTYDVARAKAIFPRLLREAQDHIVTITRRGKQVTYILSREKLESMIETLEIMSNAKAMKAIRAAQANRTRYYPLPEDLAKESAAKNSPA